MKAPINKIIPFSSVDGPGNRTAIFLQGCNLDCKYCHNPETRNICVSCGACVKTCPAGALEQKNNRINYKYEKCILCDTCIRVCSHGSSPRIRYLEVGEAFEIVKNQIPFIRGITVSGGECMLYPEYLVDLFKLAKSEGLGTLIDSNGTVLFQEYPELMAYCDGVMLDIKAFDNKAHINITGHGNETVLKNAGFLIKTGKLEEIRAVIVPDLYDGEQSIRSIGEFLTEKGADRQLRIKLIAFRPTGVRQLYSEMKSPDMEFLTNLSQILKDFGFKNVIII